MSNCIHTLHYHHSCNRFFNSFLHKVLLGSPCCLYSYWWACYSSPCSCYFLHLNATLYLLLHLTLTTLQLPTLCRKHLYYSSPHFLPPFFTFSVFENVIYGYMYLSNIHSPTTFSLKPHPHNSSYLTSKFMVSFW